MKHLTRISCFLLSIAACSISYGQMKEYKYKRQLQVVSEQWHKVILPEEVFGKTKQDLADVRIFGVTASNDTIEAPYLLQSNEGKVFNKEVASRILNASRNEKGYYFTLEIPTKEPINQIQLDFMQENFDWRIKLEGSQDQNEWFTVVDNYRILSIKKNQIDFQFSKLTFPMSKYRFFRVLINSKEAPELRGARIAKREVIDGVFKTHKVKKIKVEENKLAKGTEIDVELPLPLRVSYIKIGASNTFDYYRPVTIKYLTDSVKTQKGWKYNYSTLNSATLNSIEKNEIQLNSTTVQKLKIFIKNGENQPLTIDTIKVKGYLHELSARFTDQATYFLTYGNKNAVKPKYDIEHFIDNIPKTMIALELGDELTIKQAEVSSADPLFKNKTWLWAIMTVIILLLGWFSLRMMKKN